MPEDDTASEQRKGAGGSRKIPVGEYNHHEEPEISYYRPSKADMKHFNLQSEAKCLIPREVKGANNLVALLQWYLIAAFLFTLLGVLIFCWFYS
ncbi:hypothetical protein E4191_15960 (plasmid) [Paracoccus liaowanqingii]|uniref:Uncharacterized protein n=1 Tax=Paracoccus liaowanqingii TaxID=2560053 RepID=A0A4Y5SQ95_9RHOB|nr:hypothetical protein [Paracoccus liaowanqingii]QDA35670.1 hypothetical protein E4191_15960 [Paracoccus liaowanqingii]